MTITIVRRIESEKETETKRDAKDPKVDHDRGHEKRDTKAKDGQMRIGMRKESTKKKDTKVIEEEDDDDDDDQEVEKANQKDKEQRS